MTTITKTKSNIVETKSGKVQGYSENGVQIFKGIPYAAPPIEELRFCPPEPREPWKDVFDATEYGNYAMQGFNALEILFGKIPYKESEDCLNLNIWTPDTDGKKPVMVWIHGGAFTMGSGADPIYEGSALARRGNIVVVTINYRLGALGFLYIPDLTVNMGMQDQIAALKWVKDNIEGFGGDPKNVTIFGESAGGASVYCLLAMPAAKGLFHHAIPQSGVFGFDPTAGKKSSEYLMKKLKVEPGDIDALRKVPAKKIMKVQDRITLRPGFSDILAFSPRIDPKTLPKHPVEAIRDGSASKVDLLIGTNEHEMKLFVAIDPSVRNMDLDKLYEFIQGMGFDESKTKQLIKVYQEARKGVSSTDPDELFAAIGTDYTFRIPALRIAESHNKNNKNTYNYLFKWPSPALKGVLGCCHAIEIPFVFGTHKLPKIDEFVGKDAAVEAISEKMMDAWIAFARTGNPNNDNIPEWPPYDEKKRSTMVIGKEIKVVNNIFEKERKGWDDITL